MAIDPGQMPQSWQNIDLEKITQKGADKAANRVYFKMGNKGVTLEKKGRLKWLWNKICNFFSRTTSFSLIQGHTANIKDGAKINLESKDDILVQLKRLFLTDAILRRIGAKRDTSITGYEDLPDLSTNTIVLNRSIFTSNKITAEQREAIERQFNGKTVNFEGFIEGESQSDPSSKAAPVADKSAVSKTEERQDQSREENAELAAARVFEDQEPEGWVSEQAKHEYFEHLKEAKAKGKRGQENSSSGGLDALLAEVEADKVDQAAPGSHSRVETRGQGGKNPTAKSREGRRRELGRDPERQKKLAAEQAERDRQRDRARESRATDERHHAEELHRRVAQAGAKVDTGQKKPKPLVE